MDEAIACYRKAIELDPKYANAHNDLGIALRTREKLDEAIACLPQGHRTRPETRQRPQQPRHRPADQRKLDEAIACLPQGHRTRPEIRQRPQQPRHALADQKKLDEAIASYRKAIELDPKLSGLATHLGRRPVEEAWGLANHADPVAGIQTGSTSNKEAVEVAPQSVLAVGIPGWVPVPAGNWKASIECLEKSCNMQVGAQATPASGS